MSLKNTISSNKHSITFLLLLNIIAFPVFAQQHEIGLAYGWGKPDKLRGGRVTYRWHAWHKDIFYIDIEASHGRWQLHSQYSDKVNTWGLAPVFRLIQCPSYNWRFYIEASVGAGYISTRRLGGKYFGSQWNFQDSLGFGYIYKEFDLRFQYLHYSNAKIALPNPGIDLIPVVTLSYRF